MLFREGYFLSFLFPIFQKFSLFLTDTLLINVLTGTGIFLSIKTRFIQLRFLKQGLKNTFSGLFSKEKTAGISPFAALATSLAAQLGTGNIVGAGSAIITGGPGAVFWMWLSAFFGMATSYGEAVLSQKTKTLSRDGTAAGGAAYYIRCAFTGKTGKILSGAFSLFSTIALGFTGVAVQANSISAALYESFGIPLILSAGILTAAAGIILFRGTKTVTVISEKTVPLMAVLYIAGCLAVIIKNIGMLPQSIYLIFACAFSPKAVLGASCGITLKTVISQGIKRGLFTNEAGMGSTASAHALSDAPSPHYQGTLGIAGVFIDTFLMLSLTALAVITVLYKNGIPQFTALSGSQAVSIAFADVFGIKGASAFIALSVLFFAFASVLGWSTFGKMSCGILFGEKSKGIYTASSLMFVFLGSCLAGNIVWTLTDICNAFMVITNIPALIKLSDEIKYDYSTNCTKLSDILC